MPVSVYEIRPKWTLVGGQRILYGTKLTAVPGVESRYNRLLWFSANW